MNLPLDTLVFAAVIALSAVLGGGVYEHFVIGSSWPKNPGLIQPEREGVMWTAAYFAPTFLAFQKVSSASEIPVSLVEGTVH